MNFHDDGAPLRAQAKIGFVPFRLAMKMLGIVRLRHCVFVLCGLLLNPIPAHSQAENDPGRSIGKVSTKGNLIVVELNDGALGRSNLFNLTGRTLRFTPGGSGYRIDNTPLQWDADFGPELNGSALTLRQFAFPFSGKSWSSFHVGTTGSISFASSPDDKSDAYGHRDGGVGATVGRFDQLSQAAETLADSGPAICAFLKPRMFGPHYVNELADRVVITWDLTEPFGGLLDFTWFKTVNLFQAALHRDGTIELSYKEMNARDGIVGIYPADAGAQRIADARVHFSSLGRKDGPYAVVYEAFHYLHLPRPQDLSCTVIKALGDKFDFLAYYSDFRVDNQEASSPSDGPVGGNVTGIGDTQHEQTPPVLASRCTQGRFQLGFLMPVYVGSNEMHERPPKEAPLGDGHDITFYSRELAEASPDGKPRPYNYAMSHLGHEVCHRWAAYVSAKINGENVSLGPWPHWGPGLQTRVAFPYSLPTEASTMGGGVWQDNFDGTFTQLRDFYFVPATGYSYLDLYLMGFISAAEVPDFFLLSNILPTGKDAKGHSVFRADRTKVTIQDVIAAAGPRSPDVDHSQRKFNTGIVVMVEHGRSPSAALIRQANGIRQQWIDYWQTTTGHRSSMTSNPR
jgi:hypothetical protein